MKTEESKLNLLEFISIYENSHFNFIDHFLGKTVESLKYCNPHRKDMSSKDWLDYAIENYDVVIKKESIILEPKKIKYETKK